jgi:Tfp pilus assembly protein PilN
VVVHFKSCHLAIAHKFHRHRHAINTPWLAKARDTIVAKPHQGASSAPEYRESTLTRTRGHKIRKLLVLAAPAQIHPDAVQLSTLANLRPQSNTLPSIEPCDEHQRQEIAMLETLPKTIDEAPKRAIDVATTLTHPAEQVRIVLLATDMSTIVTWRVMLLVLKG